MDASGRLRTLATGRDRREAAYRALERQTLAFGLLSAFLFLRQWQLRVFLSAYYPLPLRALVYSQLRVTARMRMSCKAHAAALAPTKPVCGNCHSDEKNNQGDYVHYILQYTV